MIENAEVDAGKDAKEKKMEYLNDQADSGLVVKPEGLSVLEKGWQGAYGRGPPNGNHAFYRRR